MRKLLILAMILISGAAHADTFVDTVKASADDISYLAGNAGSVVSTTNAIIGNNGGGWQLGFRFQNVTIAQGRTIDSAFVAFYAGDTDSLDNVVVSLVCEDTNDAAAFSDSTDFKLRHLTSASTSVTMTANTTGNARFYLTHTGTGLKADYKNPIQEVINRASWESGNDLVIFVNDNGSSGGAYRLARTYDHGTTEGAYLYVYHSETGSAAPDSLISVVLDSLENDVSGDTDQVLITIICPAQTADSVKVRLVTGSQYPTYSTGTLFQWDYPTAGDTIIDTINIIATESYTLRARAWAYYDSATPETSIHVQDTIYFSAGSGGVDFDMGAMIQAMKDAGFTTTQSKADTDFFKAILSDISVTLPESIINKIVFAGTESLWISRDQLDSIIDYRIDAVMTAKWEQYGNRWRIIKGW